MHRVRSSCRSGDRSRGLRGSVSDYLPARFRRLLELLSAAIHGQSQGGTFRFAIFIRANWGVTWHSSRFAEMRESPRGMSALC